MAASEATAARLGSSVVVWVMSLVLFQVTVPPALRQAVAGTNFRLLVASMVTEDWALAAVQPGGVELELEEVA
jgi:hypothetical protein